MRKRLWQVGFAFALFIATATAMNFFQSADRAVSRKSAGHDFLAFYTAGTFVRTGRASQLYDLPAVRAFQRELVTREGLELPNDNFGPFWNPPLFAWVFAPLSKLPYHTAWLVWISVNAACFAGAMVILARILKREDAAASEPELRIGAIRDERSALLGGAQQPVNWKTWALVPLLTAVSMPFIQGIGHAQNTCISLLILSATVTLWRDKRAVAAGVVAGLLFYKPQLAAVVAAALVLSLGWRALAGLAITGAATIGATEWTLPGSIADFFHRLPGNVVYMQVEHRYLWERHVTLKAFWRLALQGFAIGDLQPLTKWLYIGTTVLIGLFLVAAILKLRKNADQLSRDRLIAVTIVTMPLLMPFYFDYDLLLLSVAAVLVAREQLSTGQRMPWPMLACWALLYAWTIFNPSVAGATRVNGTVLLVSALSIVLIRRATRRERAAATHIEPIDAAALRPAA